MKDDVHKYVYGALIAFLVVVFGWVSFIYISACGITLTCKRGAFSVERTPIPTLLPATLPAMNMGNRQVAASDRNMCRVAAVNLIGAWVSANSPEKDIFQFVDENGKKCGATFAEVAPLFSEPNLWNPGALSCVSCHSVDVTISSAQLDLSSYTGIMSGSRRADAKSKGKDILGDGNWNSSLLYKFLSTSNADIPGHTEAVSSGSFIVVGKPVPEPVSAPTQTPIETPKP